MLLLLSSASRKRYKNDVLRCLSAPVGGRLQFRYSIDLVAQNVLDHPALYHEKEAIVCAVELDETKSPCPLRPVRIVKIERMQIAGSTLVVNFQMLGVPNSAVRKDFSTRVETKAQGISPRATNISKKEAGKWCFAVGDFNASPSDSNRVEDWEEVVCHLRGDPSYQNEPIFWTVFDIYKGVPDENREVAQLRPWVETIVPNEHYTMQVYVYHPQMDLSLPQGMQLSLTTEPEITTSYPLDIDIDSPYDIKRWSFRFAGQSIFGDSSGWLMIGTTLRPQNKGDVVAPPEWSVHMPLTIKFSWMKFLAATAVAGSLIAVAPIIGICTQEKLSDRAKFILSAVAIVAGIGAALVGRLGISKGW
jgi:hypothetical protein